MLAIVSRYVVVTRSASHEPASGRLRSLRVGTGSAAGVVDHSYQWDSLGNLRSRTDLIGDAVAGPIVEDFEYGDPLNRLTAYTVRASAVPGGQRRVTLRYNALGMILSKSDVGSYVYGAQGPGSVRPHALLQVQGTSATSYAYDANGNLVSATGSGSKYSSISYTSFNLPDSQSGLQGSAARYTWQYDENHARIRETRTTASGTRTTWLLHPDNQGGLGFEREIASNGTAFNRHFLSAGGQVLAVLVSSGSLASPASGAANEPAYLSTSNNVDAREARSDQAERWSV